METIATEQFMTLIGRTEVLPTDHLIFRNTIRANRHVGEAVPRKRKHCSFSFRGFEAVLWSYWSNVRFSSDLANRTQVTRYNSAVSLETAVQLGVPKGSVSDPLLFSLAVNDIRTSRIHRRKIKVVTPTRQINDCRRCVQMECGVHEYDEIPRAHAGWKTELQRTLWLHHL